MRGQTSSMDQGVATMEAGKVFPSEQVVRPTSGAQGELQQRPAFIKRAPR